MGHQPNVIGIVKSLKIELMGIQPLLMFARVPEGGKRG
jgi:hypothetical protein